MAAFHVPSAISRPTHSRPVTLRNILVPKIAAACRNLFLYKALPPMPPSACLPHECVPVQNNAHATSHFYAALLLGRPLPTLWPLQVSLRNPALVVCLGASCSRWSVGANDRYLLRRVDLLASASLSTTALAFLWEERGDPGSVDEVASSCEGGG